MLGIPVDLLDIQATEPDYYKSLKTILSMAVDDLGLEMKFSTESMIFGKNEIFDLIPNGRNIDVTDENKYEYVQLISHHRMTSAISAQIDSFLEGFYDLVPPEIITIFSPTELELLICGLPDVDLDDLYVNTEYSGYAVGDKCIQWFWEALRSFTSEERAQFLQFVTGTSKVPLDGFANLHGMRGVQKFSIHRAFGDTALLPQAHTCFNQLDLPVYNTANELRDKLLLAIKEGSEGFGFA
jgi:E3 ubiquitin-protein ligase HUWE1